MDPVDKLAQAFRVDRVKAEKGLGAVLSALRISLDKDGWEAVRRLVPGAEGYIGKSMMRDGGRTAEMASITSPANLQVTLAGQGWRRDEVPKLATLVAEDVRAAVGDAAIERFLAAVRGTKS